MFTCTAWYISVLLIANFYKFLSIKSFALVSSAFDHAMKFRCVHEQECQIRLYRLYHQIIFIRIDKSLVNVFCPFFRAIKQWFIWIVQVDKLSDSLLTCGSKVCSDGLLFSLLYSFQSWSFLPFMYFIFLALSWNRLSFGFKLLQKIEEITAFLFKV